MRYDKPPLSFEEQADRLIDRGLVADKALLISRLKNVNYYRLSGYLYPYRQDNDNFKLGTTFEKVWQHYAFDRHLRLMVMDAIERIEISLRTQLIYIFAHETKSFGYFDIETYPNQTVEEYTRLLQTIAREVKRSKEKFVEHFSNKYGDMHKILPIWMSGEIVSFGCTLTMYRGVSDKIKQNIASHYGISDEVLSSWLKTINVIRNICAHHSRLWNRILGVKPFIPRKNKYPEWHDPVKIVQDRIFGVLTIFSYLLKIIAPQSKWKSRFLNLLDEYPEISRWSMGIPDNWKESPLWKRKE